MLPQLEELRSKALQELASIDDARELESWRVRYLGKKSKLTTILRSLATLPLEERRTVGARANELKTELENGLRQKEEALREAELAKGAKQETIDITLPGRPLPIGRLHPITQTLNEICEIFASMGFGIVEGPDVEWDYYNFEALNIPQEHPARDTMSTCWLEQQKSDKQAMLLRTHTTAVTARVIESMEPPIRVIEPGKVYRYEASDATHVPMFHQIDGVAVDKGITMADLKGTLYEFARRFFGEERKVRFRCDYFPFVEPGVEMAIECLVCNGRGCRVCGQSGWIEILGAGMTHPQVLERGGIDPEVYQSFAFGIGIERLPMLRYGIDDIRLFYSSDLRFLRQF
ncbi:MAG TPA: phenylalanine--tRNA ligase subunit alpha [Dehalococcoidia bacterium]|jgi:phenylalanyl-tRNA synthetase alpha chain|nr:phenylalanine--tRNA ligase subunit alpha [Dehalococcoidia bacterium]